MFGDAAGHWPECHGQDAASPGTSTGTQAANPRRFDYSPAIAQLSTAIRHEVASKQLGALSIALVDAERMVWSDGYGYRDAEKKVAATADTVYRVGSVSKLFTDIAIMKLVEDGQIDLDEPVQTYLPTFAPKNQWGVPSLCGS